MTTERKAPFASATRTGPSRAKAATATTTPKRSAKSGLINTTGRANQQGGGGAFLVLQVWESIDGLRRMIMTQGIGRAWECLRLRRESKEIPWEPMGSLIVGMTRHRKINEAQARMRTWVVLGR